jgi:acetyl esterase/lipase
LVAATAALAATEPAPLPANVVATRDLDYGGSGNPHQRLDVYMPAAPHHEALPLVVFVHGGGWSGGDKNEFVVMVLRLVATGDFAGASIDYRLTDEGPHPLQIHDVKGAIRWLRAHAAKYGFDPARVALVGLSAGGHLASLVGTSAGVAALEGDVGGNLTESSRVACVVNFCGPSDFLAFKEQSSRVDAEDPGSIIGKLLGGRPKDRLDVATAASPITYVTPDDAAFLHIHGSKDDVVPIEQSRAFDRALDAAGVSSTLIVGEGGGHLFFNDQIRGLIRAFAGRCLLGEQTVIPEAPMAVP